MRLNFSGKDLYIFDGSVIEDSLASEIEAVDLSRNQIQSVLNMAHLTRLRLLQLAKNALASCTGLPLHVTDLDLSSNRIHDVSPLRALQSLRRLALSSNPLYAATASDLPASLEELHADACGLETVQHFVHLVHLISLSICRNHVASLADVAMLGALPHLRHLNMFGNPVESADQLGSTLATHVAKLTTLNGVPLSQFRPRAMEKTPAASERLMETSRSRAQRVSGRISATDIRVREMERMLVEAAAQEDNLRRQLQQQRLLLESSSRVAASQACTIGRLTAALASLTEEEAATDQTLTVAESEAAREHTKIMLLHAKHIK